VLTTLSHRQQERQLSDKSVNALTRKAGVTQGPLRHAPARTPATRGSLQSPTARRAPSSEREAVLQNSNIPQQAHKLGVPRVRTSAQMYGPGRSSTCKSCCLASVRKRSRSAKPVHSNCPGRGSCRFHGTYTCPRRAASWSPAAAGTTSALPPSTTKRQAQVGCCGAPRGCSGPERARVACGPPTEQGECGGSASCATQSGLDVSHTVGTASRHTRQQQICAFLNFPAAH
jgi:hypothetical protein